MRTILIIPSWYMDSTSPSAGTFFKEQALLIKEDFNIVIFVQDRVICNKKDFYSFKNKLSFDKTQDIPTYTGSFPYCKELDVETNYSAQINSIEKFYQQICDDGFSIDLIHAQATYTAGVLALYIYEKLGVPYFITEHFGPFNVDFLHSLLWKKKMTDALEKAQEVLCVSNFLRQQLLMQNIKCNPKVIGNFVDDRLFNINLDYKKNDTLKLLHIAYYPGFIKDEDNLFQALSIIRDRGYDFHITFVGGGEPKGGYICENPFKLLVKKYKLESAATIIGGASRRKISELMTECDIYVSSSISETFGIAMCEAMLSGKPAVLTNNGGSSEYITPDNSVVVDIHNPIALANAIIYVHEHYDGFNPARIRNSIVYKYGHKKFREVLLEAYNSVLSKLHLKY